MLRYSVYPLALIVLVGAGTARAQDKPKVGLVMGYPASFGVLWHATDGVAVRPEITLSLTSGESTATGSAVVSTSSSWSIGVGASALFYVTNHDGLRTYISPRFTYSRNSAETQPGPGSSAAENWSNTYAVAGSFGAEYALVRRFGAFGEVGISYARQSGGYRPSSQPGVLGSTGTSNSVGARGAVGVVFYF
jgi:hypothetical protein